MVGDIANHMRLVRIIAKGAYPEAPGEFHWLVESEGQPLIAYDAAGDAHYTLGCNVADSDLRPLASEAANIDTMIDAAFISLAGRTRPPAPRRRPAHPASR